MVENQIFVGNLHHGTTIEDLKKIFSPCGEIKHISIPMDKLTGIKRGFALVTFRDKESARLALKLKGQAWLGREMRMYLAKQSMKEIDAYAK